jgi:LacI family transcriptional regulator, repressor for deo operon, udp, cdd, tsx, nupC, and nupG
VRVSITDIAKVAGVSPSTVSRALADHPRISDDTKARIRRLADEMGYTPSLLARSLVTRDTATIGVVITEASDPFLSRLVISIEQIAQEQGYSVLLCSSYFDVARELENVYAFHGRRVTGIIVIGSQINRGYLKMQDQLPPITLTNCPNYPYSVSCDNLASARQAVEHLCQLGHERIGYVGSRRSHGSNQARTMGYTRVLTERGIPIYPNLLLEQDGTLQGGFAAAKELLAQELPATAVFCFNDMTAIGLLNGLRQHGVRVPADISIVGFDDVPFAEHCYPPLTTVRQPTDRMGQQLVHMLQALIEGQEDVGPEILPATLVIRESTGPPPGLAQ